MEVNKYESFETLGNNAFKLLFKMASGDGTLDEGKQSILKIIRAMEIHGVGCLVSVTTNLWIDSMQVSEALTFVPGVKIVNDKIGGGRHLEKIADPLQT